MEYLDCYAEVSSDFDESEQERKDDQVSLNNFIDEDSEMDNKSSDYYGLTNITRSISDPEDDAFSESYIEDFLDENVELRKWVMYRVPLHKKMKFSIKDVFSKCNQIRSFLWIWSPLLKKSLMENFIFCEVFTVCGWVHILYCGQRVTRILFCG